MAKLTWNSTNEQVAYVIGDYEFVAETVRRCRADVDALKESGGKVLGSFENKRLNTKMELLASISKEADLAYRIRRKRAA